METFKNVLQKGYNSVIDRLGGNSKLKPQVQQENTTATSPAATSGAMMPGDSTSFAGTSSAATSRAPTRGAVDVKTLCGPITVKTVHPGQSSTNSSHLAVISMRGASAKTQARVPLDVVCVIEASEMASMYGHRMEMVRHTLRFIISVLGQGDRLSIVTFSDTANVDFPLTRMDEAGQRTANSVVSEIGPYVKPKRRPDDIEAGLTTGFDELLRVGQMSKGYSVGFLRVGQTVQALRSTAALLLLGTGGHRGLAEQTALISLMQTKVALLKRNHGCTCLVHTFSLEHSRAKTILTHLANAGKGKYYDLGKCLGREITPAFADCLAGLMRYMRALDSSRYLSLPLDIFLYLFG